MAPQAGSPQRLLVLGALYLGYVMHTYSRRSFQNVINYTIKEHFLIPEAVGMIVSAQQIGYTFSKFTQPFIVDRINPTVFFTLSMFCSFSMVLLFSYSKELTELLSLYWIHGFCLAFAWPSLAKILKQIIHQKEFGFWWSVMCTSSNIGAIFGAIVATYLSDRYGWRSSLRFCALLNICCGTVVATVFMFTEMPRIPIDSKKRANLYRVQVSSLRFILNPVLLANNLMFFCVYLSRYTISDWYQVYLSDMKFPQTSIAGFISAMEIGGTMGSLIAGIAADYLFIHLWTWKNPRLWVIIICGMLSTMMVYVLIFLINASSSHFHLSLTGFFYGIVIYGPVAVSGIIAIEGAPHNRQGMSFAINVICANVAMLVTGYPVSYLGLKMGWKTVFLMSYFLLCLSTTVLFLFRNHSTPCDLEDSSSGTRRSASLKKVKSMELDSST